jgi:hypothetical protein
MDNQVPDNQYTDNQIDNRQIDIRLEDSEIHKWVLIGQQVIKHNPIPTRIQLKKVYTK